VYLKDFEPYSYGLSESVRGTACIGWLGDGNEFTAGSATDEFIDALRNLISTRAVNPEKNGTRNRTLQRVQMQVH